MFYYNFSHGIYLSSSFKTESVGIEPFSGCTRGPVKELIKGPLELLATCANGIIYKFSSLLYQILECDSVILFRSGVNSSVDGYATNCILFLKWCWMPSHDLPNAVISFNL